MLDGIWEKEGMPTGRVRELVASLRRRDILHGLTPEKVRAVLEDLGPTFVKLGQLMSMRPDFLPQDYCDELQKLQAEARPIPFGTTVRGIIEKEYGCPLEKIFSSVDETPLGSASIAQVHRATLASGSEVVVKVRRPGIYRVMERDISLLRRAASLLTRVTGAGSVIDPDMILCEMWAAAKQEMDFLTEASHLDEFAQMNEGEDYAACPKVERALTTSRILVMEYIDGFRFDDIEAARLKGFDHDLLGRRLSENYVKQIAEDGYFHADPHPGNIRVRNGKIVWLDLGMVGRLTGRDRDALRRAVMALISRDVPAMKSAVLSLGAPLGKVDHARLYDDIDALIKEYASLDFASTEMGVLTRRIIGLLRAHRIGMRPGLVMFARGVLTIEGVMRRCCPGVSFVEIFAKGMEISFVRRMDWHTELEKMRREGYTLLRKTMLLPEQVSDILKMTMNGETKVNLELTGSAEPLARIDQMMNRLIISLIGSALLLGSSIICTTGMAPKIMGIPVLGVMGYLAALVLCGRLLWGIITQ